MPLRLIIKFADINTGYSLNTRDDQTLIEIVYMVSNYSKVYPFMHNEHIFLSEGLK